MCLEIECQSRNFGTRKHDGRWRVIFLSLVLEGNGRREEKGRNDFYLRKMVCVGAVMCGL